MKLPSVNSRSYLTLFLQLMNVTPCSWHREFFLLVMYCNLCCWLVCVLCFVYGYIDILRLFSKAPI